MVASDVIRTGRRRTRQACATASRTGLPSSRRRCVKSTIRMLFETTMPTIMITPISDMHIQRGAGGSQRMSSHARQVPAAQRAESAADPGTNGTAPPGSDRAAARESISPMPKLLKEARMPCTMPRTSTRRPSGILRSGDDRGRSSWRCAPNPRCSADINVDRPPELIVIDFGRRLDTLDVG